MHVWFWEDCCALNVGLHSRQGFPGPGSYDPGQLSKPRNHKQPGFLSSAERVDRRAQRFFTGNFVSHALISLCQTSSAHSFLNGNTEDFDLIIWRRCPIKTCCRVAYCEVDFVAVCTLLWSRLVAECVHYWEVDFASEHIGLHCCEVNLSQTT